MTAHDDDNATELAASAIEFFALLHRKARSDTYVSGVLAALLVVATMSLGWSALGVGRPGLVVPLVCCTLASVGAGWLFGSAAERLTNGRRAVRQFRAGRPKGERQ